MTVAVHDQGEAASRALEEGLFGGSDDELVGNVGEATNDPEPVVKAATGTEEIRDDDDDVDDFIEYADGERPLRRQRDADVSAEMVEAREEADAIFGTDQEMKELLDFTRGGMFHHLEGMQRVPLTLFFLRAVACSLHIVRCGGSRARRHSRGGPHGGT